MEAQEFVDLIGLARLFADRLRVANCRNILHSEYASSRNIRKNKGL